MHTDVTTDASEGAPVQTQTATDAGRFRRSRRSRSARKLALGLAGILGFLVTWQLLPTLGLVDPRYFPTATETLAQLGQDVRDLEFWRNVGRTLTSWGLGLLIATVLATVLGTIIGMTSSRYRATSAATVVSSNPYRANSCSSGGPSRVTKARPSSGIPVSAASTSKTSTIPRRGSIKVMSRSKPTVNRTQRE